ncbi:hypothetical protein NQ315_000749 [Exocentrus adspersus]|uniref:Uncharacterized protein n=1 Tax=Exocentrus adspersus TaxID=1586481 RepID=A0AAV8WDJ4_9CUCU|nr:hypothetical protein NQ315_000749 [Exocentrus adspersus]
MVVNSVKHRIQKLFSDKRLVTFRTVEIPLGRKKIEKVFNEVEKPKSEKLNLCVKFKNQDGAQSDSFLKNLDMYRSPLQLILVCFCVTQVPSSASAYNNFQVEYEWSYLNFTWRSIHQYASALNNGAYIPQNIVPAGLKIYKRNLYLSLPKIRRGVPVTLAYIPMGTGDSQKKNKLLRPFPNWEINDSKNCSNLQSVHSMEIDTNGIMWVLDGMRLGDNTRCPPKLVFLDLNHNGFLVYSYVFANSVSLQDGGFLNDIVIDESDGGFAYITDNSNVDPGLVVYSRRRNRAWKLRDRTMFPELWAANFFVENKRFENLVPIDGIALSPKSNRNRTVFYCSLTGLNLFSLSASVLKDEELCKTDKWRKSVKHVGEKHAQTDGMMMDSTGTLYYTLLPFNGVGNWNIKEEFVSSRIVEYNRHDMVWPDGFAMDQEGYLYLISNRIFDYFDQGVQLNLTDGVKFRVFKLYTGTKSYLYGQ